MPRVKTLTEMGDSTVSKNAPLSPEGSKLLNSPITLDFDPLSFEFKDGNSGSLTTNKHGFEGARTEVEAPKSKRQRNSAKVHDNIDLNIENTSLGTQNKSHYTSKNKTKNSHYRSRKDSDSSSDEQQSPSSGSGSESDVDSPDSHAEADNNKYFKGQLHSNNSEEKRAIAQRNGQTIQSQKSDNEGNESQTTSDAVTCTETDDSKITSPLTTNYDLSYSFEDIPHFRSIAKHRPRYHDIDSEEYNVGDVLEKSVNEEKQPSLDLHLHADSGYVTKDLTYDKHVIEDTCRKNNKVMLEESENKYDLDLEEKVECAEDLVERDGSEPKNQEVVEHEFSVSVVAQKEHGSVNKDSDHFVTTKDNQHEKEESFVKTIHNEHEGEEHVVTTKDSEHEGEGHVVTTKDSEHEDEEYSVSNKNSEHDNEEHDVANKDSEHDDEEHDVTNKDIEHDGEELAVTNKDSERDDEELAVTNKDSEHDDEELAVTNKDSEHEYGEHDVSNKDGDHDNEEHDVTNKDSELEDEEHVVTTSESEHDDEEHDAMHEKSDTSDSDVEKSGKKKTTTQKTTASSVNVVEKPRYSTSSNESRDEEKIKTLKESHEEKITTTTKLEQKTTRQYHEVNGVSESEKKPVDSDNSSDSESNKPEVEKENVIHLVSVDKLKTEYITHATHQSQLEQQPPKDSILERINLKSLKTEYITHAAHKSQQEQAPKDSILKAIDLKSMASTYIEHVQHSDQRLLTPSRGVVRTGVDIHSLRRFYQTDKNKDEKPAPSRGVIQTGVNISKLMSSFTESQKNHVSIVEKEPLEEVKPSVNRAKVARTFSQGQKDEKETLCRICGKHVYLMDKIKAEKSAFHKLCFRCKECNKALNVDTYSSHEGEIYCKPHFRELFRPKANFEEDSGPMTSDIQEVEAKPKKFEMIIRENVPEELPPDVVRSDTKVEVDLPSVPDLTGIRSRFESPQEEIHYASIADKFSLQRTESVMQRLAKYQSAVSGEENGEILGSSEDEDYDPSVVRESKKKEKVKFVEMSNLKSQWESGNVGKPEAKGADTKDELNKLRQKMCLGRSESKRALYERACKEAESNLASKSASVELGNEVKTVNIKEKFEKGELESELEQEKQEKARREKEEDFSVFSETGTAAGARSLFKQIDATTVSSSSVKSPSADQKRAREVPISTVSPTRDADVVKCSDPVSKDEIEVDPTQLTQRFHFFENYKEESKERKRFQITPPRETKKEESPVREIERDPNIVRSSDAADEVIVTDTAKKMLNKFKQLENQSDSGDVPAGPKPVKRITPPREYTKIDDEHEPSPEPERDPNIILCSYKNEDDIAWDTEKAKNLRAKFEHWQPDAEQDSTKNENEFLPETDTAKNLRAKFEAIREESIKPKEKPKPRVRRFVDLGSPSGEDCDVCGKRLYPVEKMEASGIKFHRNCFRCTHCNSMLRLENYTTGGGKLYCSPHFKLLSISKSTHETVSEMGHETASETGHEAVSEMGHETASETGHEAVSEMGHETASETGHEAASEMGHETASETGHETEHDILSESGHEDELKPTKTEVSNEFQETVNAAGVDEAAS
ncbi:kinesin-related protein 4-like [Limulus polyphemus]|uniref:Kinesin-related protein 4-like n=1 Tax=Limulus polyphemus TaxID=6850 RepID=A0ABM1TH03_LIMPO|nr:kinesin-related protein 4-like [Limulus polyphemus]